MIGIIDYGMGNLGSVTNACSFLKLPARIVTRAEELDGLGAVILPGVGAFADCMRHLRENGFVDPIRRWIDGGRPFLGICLGLQVLYEGSEESPGDAGFGLLPGVIRRFADRPGLKVPQIGWNRLQQVQPACPLFRGIPDGSFFYFVHSYRADGGAAFTAGATEYGETYTSAVWRDNVAAVQFHPEKSQEVGLHLLRNFAAWARVDSEAGA